MLTLKKIAKDMNEQTPILIDEETKMMSVIASHKTLMINMALIKFSSSEVDSRLIYGYAKESLNYNICQNNATKFMIDQGFRYIHIYSGNDGKFITRVVFDKYDC